MNITILIISGCNKNALNIVNKYIDDVITLYLYVV